TMAARKVDRRCHSTAVDPDSPSVPLGRRLEDGYAQRAVVGHGGFHLCVASVCAWAHHLVVEPVAGTGHAAQANLKPFVAAARPLAGRTHTDPTRDVPVFNGGQSQRGHHRPDSLTVL